jgi:hypothetical protein
VVRAHVLKQLAPSKWLLGIGGRVISAFSERSLAPGMTFPARVRIEAGTVLLQPYHQATGAETALRFLASEGLPQDELSTQIVRALLRSGMALDPARIRGLYAFFKKREASSPRAIRAYLLMQEKGLDPSHGGLDRFLDALDGFGGRGDEEGRDRHGARERHGGGEHGGGDHGGEEDAGTGDDEERGGHPQGSGGRRPKRKGKPAADAIREITLRKDSEPNHLLHAFNHMRAEGGHWVVVPFSLDDEERDYHGSIRIHFTGSRLAFDRAVVSVESAGEGEGAGWQFALVRGAAGSASAGTVTVFHPQGAPPPPDLVSQLEERLEPLGIDGIAVESSENFDGFSTNESMDILKNIDTEA